MLLRSLPPLYPLPTGLILAPDPCLSNELRSTDLQPKQRNDHKTTQTLKPLAQYNKIQKCHLPNSIFDLCVLTELRSTDVQRSTENHQKKNQNPKTSSQIHLDPKIPSTELYFVFVSQKKFAKQTYSENRATTTKQLIS
jgi:hypothetical protein